jgi:uncharacterized membrane protein HdeD (DUF308 family)
VQILPPPPSIVKCVKKRHYRALIITGCLLVTVTLVCLLAMFLTPFSLAQVLGVVVIAGALVNIYTSLVAHYKDDDMVP